VLAFKKRPALTASGEPDVVLCGISVSFETLSPAQGKIAYVLRTRAPLYRGRSPFSCDLHVLSAPLTFALSQDQTLQLKLRALTIYQVGACSSCLPQVAQHLAFCIARLSAICCRRDPPFLFADTPCKGVSYGCSDSVFKDRLSRSPFQGALTLLRPTRFVKVFFA
jgi:hypothetical protein